MKKLCNILIVIAMGILATGCATIAGDNTRDVRVETRPAGATIYVDNQRYGVTPAVVTLPSYIYGGKLITVKKDGYQEQSMMVNSQFQPVALLDIFFWPTFIIDGVTGNIVKMNTANRSFVTDLVPQDPIK